MKCTSNDSPLNCGKGHAMLATHSKPFKSYSKIHLGGEEQESASPTLDRVKQMKLLKIISVLTSPHLTSAQLNSAHPISSHLNSHYPASPQLTSPRLALPRLTSPRLSSAQLSSPHLISPHRAFLHLASP